MTAEGPTVEPVGGPTMGMAGAVRATGVSRSTMQRRLREGAIPGAHRGDDGDWVIPVVGLISAGMTPRTTPPETSTPTPPEPPRGTTSPAEVSPSEVERLRAEVERLRAELDHSRAVADERARHLDDLRDALAAMSRALPVGPQSPPSAPPSQTETRRRWWPRGR